MALYAFDGTWKLSQDRTNVDRFRMAYASAESQPPFYAPGIGTRFSYFGRYLGGLLGFGMRARISGALAHVADQFESGDETIDIVGFSRGAATAAAFSWVLHEWGIRIPKKTTPFTFGVRRFRHGECLQSKPNIRFVGLFDTVFTSEDMTTLLPISQSFKSHGGESFLKGDFDLPPNVGSAFHAMSIHERTVGFDITRISNAYEVWFPGVHGDVGSGSATLGWMIAKARSVGVPVAVEGPDGEEDSTVPKTGAWRGARRRVIRKGDRIHESAKTLSLGVDPSSLKIEGPQA